MFLLDTCAFLWLHGDARQMPQKVRRTLNTATGYSVSVSSIWEIALKVKTGKLSISLPIEDWVRQTLTNPKLNLLPITPALAVASTRLPFPFHKDPFDRMIVATAVQEHLTVLTRDARILAYPGLSTLEC